MRDFSKKIKLKNFLELGDKQLETEVFEALADWIIYHIPVVEFRHDDRGGV